MIGTVKSSVLINSEELKANGAATGTANIGIGSDGSVFSNSSYRSISS